MTESTNPLTIIYEIGFASFLLNFMRYFIAASIVAAIVWFLMKGRLRSRKIQTRTATNADMRREIVQSMRSCVVYIGATVFIAWCINMGYLQKIGPSLGWWQNIALLVAMILAHDAYFYWTHRAMHHPLLFKRFHLVHHRSITPTPFAAYSFSVGEACVMALFVVFWQFFIRTPGVVIGAFMVFQITRNAMGHAGFELMPRWWLSSPFTRWINSTTHHDLHHAGSFNHNFGLYFTWWDKMMGTEHPDYVKKFDEVTSRPVAPAEPQPVLSPVVFGRSV